ncbi:hypothetical protein PILCRDRAFT_369963 [Piloderma croceum F 1598]|uniref:Uncharacterized protein n=1 Tax=Piloderma croceum (strain F 1598) TaxID=765440 RepID=A0A0C3FYV4_PILCF|nr:hypothetical protein PILCRDRAFT_369963 [Piloderma croceum F 1598]
MFRKLCGNDTLKNVLIVTNMWDDVSREVGEARETDLAKEDMFFKSALDKHVQLRHDNTLDSAQAILRHIIANHPMPLRIQYELVDESKHIFQTAASEEANRELSAQTRLHREELAKIQQEAEIATRAKADESRKKLEALQIQRLSADEKALEVEAFAREQRTRADRNIQEMAKAARQQAAFIQ